MSNIKLRKKAKIGEKCTHCGSCCYLEVCGLGKLHYGDSQKPPCPALYQLTDTITGDTRLLCNFIVAEKISGGELLLSKALGIGKGCSSDD